MKQLKKRNDHKTLPSNKDVIYYWSNNRLIYYATIEGTGKTIHCADIDAADQLLNYRENQR